MTSKSPAPPGSDSWQKLDEADRYRDLSDYARPLALRIVGVLRDTPVRSVHVTWVFLGLGLLAGALIGVGGRGAWATAAVLLQIKNLLDAVDGSLARAQGRPSRVGRFLDSVGDLLVNLVVYGGFAVALRSLLGAGAAGGLAGFTLLGALLQGSTYHVLSVAYRAERRGTLMSRLDEREPEEEAPTPFLRLLKTVYLFAYAWQDRLVQSWLRAATGPLLPGEATVAPGIARDPVLSRPHLTFISVFGLGTQLALTSVALLTAALLADVRPLLAYLLLVGGAGNALLLADLVRIRWSRPRRRGAARRDGLR